MTELLQEKFGAIAGTTNNIVYSSTTLLLTFYYRFISRNSYYVFTICLSLNVIAFFGSLFLPESVKWLVSTEQYTRARDELNYIAKFNNIKPIKITRFIQDDEVEEENEEDYQKIDD